MTHSSWEHLVAPGGFDDPRIKRQFELAQRLHQSVPSVGDGGREILWWCPVCSSAWHQRGYLSPDVRLSKQARQRLAHRLGANPSPALLPRMLCPACTLERWGGVASLEETLGQSGYCLSWESHKTALFLVCTLISAEAFSPGDEQATPFFSLSDVAIPPSAHLRETLRWLASLAAPQEERVRALAPHHQEQLSRWWKLTSARWCGYTWKQSDSPLGPVVVMLACNCQEEEEQVALSLLLTFWQQISPIMEQIIGL